jgi:hypothetical protein
VRRSIEITPMLSAILTKASEKLPLTKQECRHLFSLPEQSFEAGILMAVADHLSRRRFHNKAVLEAGFEFLLAGDGKVLPLGR